MEDQKMVCKKCEDLMSVILKADARKNPRFKVGSRRIELRMSDCRCCRAWGELETHDTNPVICLGVAGKILDVGVKHTGFSGLFSRRLGCPIVVGSLDMQVRGRSDRHAR